MSIEVTNYSLFDPDGEDDDYLNINGNFPIQMGKNTQKTTGVGGKSIKGIGSKSRKKEKEKEMVPDDPTPVRCEWKQE